MPALLHRLDFDYKNDHDEQLDLCCDELVEEIQLDEIAFFDVVLAAMGV